MSDSLSHPLGDALHAAFSPVPDRSAYVARSATEAALAALVRELERGTRAAVLEGPAGIGKSLLLRLLPDRLGPGYELLHVVTGALPLPDLLALALGGRTGRGAQSPSRLLSAAAARRGAIVVLPIDDAEALDAGSVRGLAGLLRNAGGGLRLVLAADDGDRSALDLLGDALARIRLDRPLSESELRAYLIARLERAGVPGAVRRRLEAQLERLHALSGGNPALVNRLALDLGVTAGPEAPAALERTRPATRGPSALAAAPPDPFGPASSAAPYQPRGVTEAHLGRIERLLVQGARSIVLRGPAGIGKTTLLRVLEKRLLEPIAPVAIPYARLQPGDFWSYVLHQLGAPRGADAEREVVDAARRLRRAGGILVLLVDEADSLPPETAARVAAAIEAAAGALRVVLAADDGGPEGRLPLVEGAELIRVEERLAPAETEAFLLGRLLHFGAASAVRRRFDAGTIAALHQASGGLPGELNRLAGEIERRALEPLLAGGDPTPERVDPVAPPEAPEAAALRERRRDAPPGWGWRALALLPHLGFGIGIPLALFALWLWLAPLFSG